MNKSYLKAIEKKLKKQGKSEKQIERFIKDLVNPEEEERDLPEVTNPLFEEDKESYPQVD